MMGRGDAETFPLEIALIERSAASDGDESFDLQRRCVERATYGGKGGIRTHGTLAGTAVFKTAALNHSATFPSWDSA